MRKLRKVPRAELRILLQTVAALESQAHEDGVTPAKVLEQVLLSLPRRHDEFLWTIGAPTPLPWLTQLGIASVARAARGDGVIYRGEIKHRYRSPALEGSVLAEFHGLDLQLSATGWSLASVISGYEIDDDEGQCDDLVEWLKSGDLVVEKRLVQRGHVVYIGYRPVLARGAYAAAKRLKLVGQSSPPQIHRTPPAVSQSPRTFIVEQSARWRGRMDPEASTVIAQYAVHLRQCYGFAIRHTWIADLAVFTFVPAAAEWRAKVAAHQFRSPSSFASAKS